MLLSLYCISSGQTAADSFVDDNNPTAQNQNAEAALKTAEVIKKFGRKQGVFLVDGSVADFKNNNATFLVEIDWDGATNTADVMFQTTGKEKSQELTVPINECIEAFNTKLIDYFNGNSKNIQLTTEQDDNYNYILKFKPTVYTYSQNGGMGSSTTVNVSGFISINSKNDTQVAELYFQQFYRLSAQLGGNGKNTKATLKTWQCVAEIIDNNLLKLFKKGK